MLPMVKGHVIKYHKKPSPHPSLAPESTLNDRPPRLHRTLWSPHNNPITSGSCDDPPFYRGTTLHRRWALRATPPLLYPPRERVLANLCGSFSSVNFAMLGSCD
ncbi:hypothetical protein AVEN_146909-1 [Araneus ventricosus]|uniref:Uncharacterized protein n=1 Tax=Araneus ventricosus TaxID=182803 RepID=A0A4Y2S4W1_ARAVE|nr:hypothetical protein AVEN_146909-1 [Araneus ventricosus]